MLKCLALMVFALAAAPLSGCVESAAAPEPVAREWECVNACFGERGGPCHQICRLSIDEPGFQVVPPEPSCSDLRPIDVCGDGCCDIGELWDCREDCKITELEVVPSGRESPMQIVSFGKPMGLISERGVEVSQAACEY